jgi:rare lipoprotein A
MQCDLHTIASPAPRAMRRLRCAPIPALLLLFTLFCFVATARSAQEKPRDDTNPSVTAKTAAAHADHPAAEGAHLDRSGKTRKGKVSYYGHRFYKKKMADGTLMDPQSNAAASKTLPIGTKAKVTNLKNGSTAVVEIRDRGPYVGDRIVDVTPKTADKLGLKEDGTAPVAVKPVEVPQADGTMKPGSGATDTGTGTSAANSTQKQ